MIIAKYPGKCNDCGAAINRGDSVNWAKHTGTICLLCKPLPKSDFIKRTRDFDDTVAGENARFARARAKKYGSRRW